MHILNVARVNAGGVAVAMLGLNRHVNPLGDVPDTDDGDERHHLFLLNKEMIEIGLADE